jgi:hypothetical protein
MYSPRTMYGVGKLPAAAERQPKRPLWTCPRCGKQYVTRNMWHSCVVVDLESHFAGKSPRARELFDAWLAAVRSTGPVTVSVSKTRIEFMTRARFTGAVIRHDYLKSALWLKRRAWSRHFTKVELLGRSDWLHHFEIHDETDIDAELMGLVVEARAVGDQEAAATPAS